MATTLAELHEQDFHAWAQDQATALRRLAAERWNGPLDLERLAEEIEDMGAAARATVASAVERVIEHLLKLQHSPATGPRRGWRVSVNAARGDLDRTLTPSLHRGLAAELPRAFERARRAAVLGLELHGEHEAAAALPRTCPFTLEQVLDADWWPPA
jgi:type IV secretory pathway VirJ component